MRPGKIFSRIVLLFFLISHSVVMAQETNLPASSQDIKKDLDRIFGLDQDLCSGISYVGQATGSVAGHPYWIDSEWKTGSVIINNKLFENLLLKYDIAGNSLVLNTINLNGQAIHLCLNKYSISEFTMENRKFIRYPGDNISDNNYFCEVCFDGQIKYLLIKDKVLAVATGSSTDFKYKEYFSSYLIIDDQLIKFKSKRTLYKLFPDQKKKLRNFIFKNALTPGQKNIADRTRLIDYCNSLITNS
jgi:hypothetical protein